MKITGRPTHALEPLLPAEALERTLRDRFDRIAPFTVGAEEELLIVDSSRHAPIPAADWLLAVSGSDARISLELRSSQIESITPTCVTAADVQRELASVRRLLATRLEGTGHLVGAGTHPLASGPGPVSDSPRYHEIAADHPWAASHTSTCGLHVHVAAGGAERTLAVYNALRSYLPELIALGANAPIYRGKDSGLATVRPKLNQFWPRAGIPPAFASWREFAEFSVWARDGGAIPDGSYHWWDLRLSACHGTIEVRAADTQTRVEDAGTIAAFVQCLVFDLASRYDAGDVLPVLRDERIAENAWLATRDGTTGHLIDLVTGARIPTSDCLHELAERLRPSGALLGCEDELRRIEDMHESGGAAWQREIFLSNGPAALMEHLVEETARMPAGLWLENPATAALDPLRGRPRAAIAVSA